MKTRKRGGVGDDPRIAQIDMDIRPKANQKIKESKAFDPQITQIDTDFKILNPDQKVLNPRKSCQSVDKTGSKAFDPLISQSGAEFRP